MSYFSAITQRVTADANNSSTTNLAAGNTYLFEGEISSTLNVAGIQVSLFADKNCTVQVQQSPDATPHWDLTNEYRYVASSSFGITVQAVSSYFRVRVFTASETTGTFRLQVALCPIVEALPQSLDENGNLKVGSAYSEFNFRARISPQGDQRMVEKVRLAGAQFDGAVVDGNYWLTSVSTGTITQAGTECIITSGTANAHYARVYSARRARYVGGMSNSARIHIRLADTGTANVARRWGVAWGASMPTISDGAYFELSGTTFSVVTLKNGAPSKVASGSFNGHGSFTYAPDTNNHVYEILYNNASVWFSIDGVLIHTVTSPTATLYNTLAFHLWMDVANSGNSAAVAMYCRNAVIARLGLLETQPKYYNLSGNAATHTLKLGGGILHNILFNNTTGTSFIIYDGVDATGVKMGTITTATAALGSWNYHVPFFNGLVIVTTGNGLDMTVIYE